MSDMKDLWPVEPLSEATKARMIKRAAAGPQLKPWPQMIALAVEQALSDWRYGLAYKLAGACACVALGLGIGFNITPNEHDLAGTAFMTSTMPSATEVPE